MGKKIMVVDDEPDTLILVKAVLEPEGFKVDDFDSSQKALDALNKGIHPDIILLDMRMPIISGSDFCDRVFKDKKLKDLRIVFFTASSDLDKEIAKQNGAKGYIFKPFDNNELVKQVNKYLKL